ncbi:MAG TPA: hypothetical protein VJ813_03120 [Vicinamibacterales bacterium]|nr:hypothetical protein [Vicinamibacterales bacterium]
MVKRPVAEVTLPPPDDSVSDRVAAGVERAAQALVWPRMCCCCVSTTALDSIPIYSPTTFGRNAIIHIPYCRRCQSHHGRASHKAFESASTVLIVGLMILLIAFLAGTLPDIAAFLLQLLVVVGAVSWGVRTYFVARAEIKKGITPACSAAETAAVRFLSARTSGWRFRPIRVS